METPPTYYRVMHMVRGERPKTTPSNQPIPDDWIIFNAPRSLYASFDNNNYPLDWQGEFIHGIFYAAVSPDDIRSIKRNNELDGWALIWHNKEEIYAWLNQYYADYYPGRKINLDEFDQELVYSTFVNLINKGAH